MQSYVLCLMRKMIDYPNDCTKEVQIMAVPKRRLSKCRRDRRRASFPDRSKGDRERQLREGADVQGGSGDRRHGSHPASDDDCRRPDHPYRHARRQEVPVDIPGGAGRGPIQAARFASSCGLP